MPRTARLTDRGTVLACAVLFLGFPALSSFGEDARPAADAMAFVRVAGDLNVRFTKVYKQPYVERDVEVATGSGFVIAPSGLVLTNLHVVSDEPFTRVIDGYEAEIALESRRIEVAIGPGGSVAVLEGAVVASDADLDLAVLQVTAADLPYLPFGDSDAVEPGGPVQALGFPFGRKAEVGKQADAGVVPRVSVTAGSLSAAREDDEGGRRYLQTDASVQPGNSGGPMLDDEGYAVGVVRMKLAREATARGAGFGIPINLVKDFLDAHGLLALLPVSRLRPGVVHSFDWKGLRVEMPDGFQDGSPSRLRVATGEVGTGSPSGSIGWRRPGTGRRSKRRCSGGRRCPVSSRRRPRLCVSSTVASRHAGWARPRARCRTASGSAWNTRC